MKLRSLVFASLLVVSLAGAAGAASTDVERMKPIYDSYDRIHASLAADALTGVAASAATLSKAASRASAAASGAAATELDALASAATELASATALPAARSAFGEVSRHLVAAVAARPELGAGRLVFACPMAKGYRKWVQKGDRIENPYMGTKMLGCGTPSDWKE